MRSAVWSFIAGIVCFLVLSIYIASSVIGRWRYPLLHDNTRSSAHVVAYYQTSGSNWLASYTALRLFRITYPTAPLYIHYDMLENSTHDQLAVDFGASLVTYNKQASDGSSATHGMYFSSIQSAEEYIRRLRHAASLQPSGWVFLLEDDVWVWGQVDEQDLKFDVSGTCWGRYEARYSELIRTHATLPVFQNATCYGGCGGHFVSCIRLLGITESPSTRGLITGLLDLGIPVASDVLLCALILQNGGSIGEYQGFYEYGGLMAPVLKTKSGNGVKTLHQMKWLYFLRYVFG